MPPFFPAPEGVPAAREEALARHLIIKFDHAGFQTGQRHDDLERGTGRIDALDRAVVHRMTRVFHKLHPVLRRDSPGKEVRVVRGVTCEGEDLSGILCKSLFFPQEASEAHKDRVVEDCIQRIKSEKVKLERERLHEQIKIAQSLGDDERLKQLTQEFHALIKKRTDKR